MPALKHTRILGLSLAFILALVVANLSAQAQSDEQYELGARLYAENCAVCHGPNGEGRVGATLAKDWPSIRPDLTVRAIITDGVPNTAMPAWGQANGGPLSEAEIDALMVFILSWQTGGAPNITPGPTNTPLPPITPPPNVEGDPNRGAELYGQNCEVCHGAQGEGRIGATLSKDWPSVRPDLTIRSTIASGVPNSNMPAWSQANGGPLSETDIDDLTSYILTWEGSEVQAQPTVVGPEVSIHPWLRGWGGVILFVVILTIVLVAAVLLQRQRS